MFLYTVQTHLTLTTWNSGAFLVCSGFLSKKRWKTTASLQHLERCKTAVPEQFWRIAAVPVRRSCPCAICFPPWVHDTYEHQVGEKRMYKLFQFWIGAKLPGAVVCSSDYQVYYQQHKAWEWDLSHCLDQDQMWPAVMLRDEDKRKYNIHSEPLLVQLLFILQKRLNPTSPWPSFREL